ncbi:thioredoxin family protein [Acutalibacter muris]|uniref:thioredoxin family protein n=1 Tax=Acutalibacter muris TaxID=1796620 RepID=UPI001C3E98BE|nr:thioredoxin family protein [Acutalibacter muris]
MAIQNADKTNFKELIREGFVIADFYGTTCVPCKLFSKILEDIKAEIPFLNIVKLNTTDNPELAEEYGITAVPTVHFYKDGQLVASHVGVMQPQAVKEVIAQHMYA